MSLSRSQAFAKRTFDLFLALFLIALLWPIIFVSFLISCVDTSSWGVFSQVRIGMHGKPFRIFKIRTMTAVSRPCGTVTVSGDPRITPIGALFRRYKIDELPQLLNVLIGQMSFVGPRPDVPGYADQLCGPSRKLLDVRPGITGPASLKYRFEEELLALQSDPVSYDRDILWPDKVRINCDYISSWSLVADFRILYRTFISSVCPHSF